jgi:hypothetical protein
VNPFLKNPISGGISIDNKGILQGHDTLLPFFHQNNGDLGKKVYDWQLLSLGDGEIDGALYW